MTWSDIAADWPTTVQRLKHRFPFLDETALARAPAEPSALSRHLADQHHLTLQEAEEELTFWMARQHPPVARNAA